jgi:hypothetical protein
MKTHLALKQARQKNSRLSKQIIVMTMMMTTTMTMTMIDPANMNQPDIIKLQ